MFKKIMDRAKSYLSKRKPMPGNRKKKVRTKGGKATYGTGPAGENVDYKLNEDSPMGKAQTRSKKQQAMLDAIDDY